MRFIIYNIIFCFLLIGFAGCYNVDPEVKSENAYVVSESGEIYPGLDIYVSFNGQKLNEMVVSSVEVGSKKARYQIIYNTSYRKELKIEAPSGLTAGEKVNIVVNYENGDQHVLNKEFTVAAYTELISVQVPDDLLIYEPIKIICKNLDFIDGYHVLYDRGPLSSKNVDIKKEVEIRGDTLFYAFNDQKYFNVKVKLIKESEDFLVIPIGDFDVYPKFDIWNKEGKEQSIFSVSDTISLKLYSVYNQEFEIYYKVTLTGGDEISYPLNMYGLRYNVDKNQEIWYTFPDSIPLGEYDLNIYAPRTKVYYKPSKSKRIKIE